MFMYSFVQLTLKKLSVIFMKQWMVKVDEGELAKGTPGKDKKIRVEDKQLRKTCLL